MLCSRFNFVFGPVFVLTLDSPVSTLIIANINTYYYIT